MKNVTTSVDCLKRLLQKLEPQFIKHLLAVIWKVVAAVHCFSAREITPAAPTSSRDGWSDTFANSVD